MLESTQIRNVMTPRLFYGYHCIYEFFKLKYDGSGQLEGCWALGEKSRAEGRSKNESSFIKCMLN